MSDEFGVAFVDEPVVLQLLVDFAELSEHLHGLGLFYLVVVDLELSLTGYER